jgi:hypothetical protein
VGAEQVIVVVLIVAGFGAGWIARGAGARRDEPAAEEEPATASSAASPQEAALVDAALAAYDNAVERWLDEGTAIGDDGRRALDELDDALDRLAAAVRSGAPASPAVRAHAALERAAWHLTAFERGSALDAPTSRALAALEDEVAAARQAMASAPAA